jgi:hypothetical protein
VSLIFSSIIDAGDSSEFALITSARSLSPGRGAEEEGYP